MTSKEHQYYLALRRLLVSYEDQSVYDPLWDTTEDMAAEEARRILRSGAEEWDEIYEMKRVILSARRFITAFEHEAEMRPDTEAMTQERVLKARQRLKDDITRYDEGH